MMLLALIYDTEAGDAENRVGFLSCGLHFESLGESKALQGAVTSSCGLISCLALEQAVGLVLAETRFGA